MFSGIIEVLGEVLEIVESGTNKRYKISCPFLDEVHPDQSISHNGVCLTVESVESDGYWVSAVQETLVKTNLGTWAKNDWVNIERSMKLGGRLDGHMVQGHVDDIAECLHIEEKKGSWVYTFGFDTTFSNLLVEKGSIALNGISLTVFEVEDQTFRVAIIPYTYEHTNLKNLRVGKTVNLEFDILGKYVSKILNG